MWVYGTVAEGEGRGEGGGRHIVIELGSNNGAWISEVLILFFGREFFLNKIPSQHILPFFFDSSCLFSPFSLTVPGAADSHGKHFLAHHNASTLFKDPLIKISFLFFPRTVLGSANSRGTRFLAHHSGSAASF